jgi:hypothetical protein
VCSSAPTRLVEMLCASAPGAHMYLQVSSQIVSVLIAMLTLILSGCSPVEYLIIIIIIIIISAQKI